MLQRSSDSATSYPAPQVEPDRLGLGSFDAFVQTIARLRAPDGCPWDRAQTHESISSNMIEEAYEAVDAIDSGDADHLCEELGDVLLQVVLQSQIAADAGEFTIDDVCRTINEKMVRRHPHIFGQEHADTPEDVEVLWGKVKLAEKEAAATQNETEPATPPSLLDSVPRSFPALLQAQKISRKAVACGFEWDTVEDVWDQVRSEVREFQSAEEPADRTVEFGDILFSLVNVARKEGIDAETALRLSNEKFRRRWAFIEGAAWAQGRPVEDLSTEELQTFWDQAKTHEKESSAT